MKTLKILLSMFTLTALVWAQTDSLEVASDSLETASAESLVDSSMDVTAADTSLAGFADMDSVAMDSASNGMDIFSEPEPEMVLVKQAPRPASLAGLMNEGPVYYWSNDHLDGLGLEALDYITIEDPTLIAIKANDCMDIVCHLLASDSTGLDYVIVAANDSTPYKVYDTVTKVVMLEAGRDSLATALDSYLRGLAGDELMAVFPETAADDDSLLVLGETTVLPVSSGRDLALKIKRRKFRTMQSMTTNPANLARSYDTYTTWNLLPDLNVSVRNSLLTPGWYGEWWTKGIDLDEGTNMKDYLATLLDKEIRININPEFRTVFGFRIGRFGLNLAGLSHIRFSLPGDILATPMQDIIFDEPIENAGMEVEILPFVAKSTLAYAHPLSTPYGDLKVGLGVNVYLATGYAHFTSDDFTIVTSADSVIATASGEGWLTVAGAEGSLTDPNFDGFEVGTALSKPGLGLDIGAILDLQPLINEEVEVHVALTNVLAKYEWNDVRHESWTYELRLPAPNADAIDTLDVEAYQTTTTTLISDGGNYTLELPTVFNLYAYYQPLDKILLGAGIQKAFTDELVLGYGPDLSFNYQINLYPVSFWDVSYFKTSRFGDPVHTFGSGFHFGFLETALTVSFFNGVNAEAKGVGLGFRSSLHF
jgi:hypothetical protein